MPTRCLWDEGRRTCALGALAVDKKVRRDNYDWAVSAKGLGLKPAYVGGFITGFDGYGAPRRWPKAFRLGHEDGLACARAVFEQRLHLQYPAADLTDLSPYLAEPPPDGSEPEHQFGAADQSNDKKRLAYVSVGRPPEG